MGLLNFFGLLPRAWGCAGTGLGAESGVNTRTKPAPATLVTTVRIDLPMDVTLDLKFMRFSMLARRVFCVWTKQLNSAKLRGRSLESAVTSLSGRFNRAIQGRKMGQR